MPHLPMEVVDTHFGVVAVTSAKLVAKAYGKESGHTTPADGHFQRPFWCTLLDTLWHTAAVDGLVGSVVVGIHVLCGSTDQVPQV